MPVSDETLSPHPPDLRHLRTHGVEALDATGRDDGARHASSRPRHEGQVEGDQEGIWAQVVEGDELCPLDPTSQTYFSLIDKARKVISSSDRY